MFRLVDNPALRPAGIRLDRPRRVRSTPPSSATAPCAAVAHRQPGDLLDERPDPAVCVLAEEPPDTQPKDYPPTSHRRIGNPALVPRMHPHQHSTTGRTHRLHRTWGRPDPHRRTELLDPLDHHTGQVREEHARIMIITPGTWSQSPRHARHRARTITKYGPEPLDWPRSDGLRWTRASSLQTGGCWSSSPTESVL